ncbi:MAG TPA: glycosyl hydrolase family 28-related protein, partial [Pilimelia sp.]|nr:glycosyl hydrolase family 28-related protein [Pilimelia sp.]
MWTEYAGTPYTHPQIPHVSFAGYRRGAAPPTRPVVANVLAYGAKPDGSADAAPAINRAIEDVGRAGGGAVLVPQGTFRIDDVIRVGYDRVVLRGAGRSATTLFATRSLEQIIGINRSPHGGDNSAWSWSGGLVWVCHRDRYRALIQAIRAQAWPMERWAGNEGNQLRQLATVAAGARRGGFTLTLGSAAGLAVGQRVMLSLSDDSGHSLLRHMAGEVTGAASYNWDSRTKLLSWLPFLWPVRISAISGTRITLDQPLPLDVRTAWRPRLMAPQVPPVVEAGVEKLTVRMTLTPRPSHLKDKGYNGVVFQCAWDCWADDVGVVDSDNGILLVSSKGVTISRTSVTGRGRHHSYACREQCHDNLFTDFRVGALVGATSPGAHHGINVEGLSCGNVWSKGTMEAGTFDTHRGMPFNTVRTQIVINN